MNIQVYYQDLDHSQWMEQFVSNRVQKLKRFFNGFASVSVYVQLQNTTFTTTLAIRHLNRDYAFKCDGQNFYESFTGAMNKANRSLSDQKRALKDKINRRYIPLKNAA